VIAIIGTLVGLLLPGVNAARERARQGQCLNNMKELGLGMVSYATDGKGEFPGLVQYQRTTIRPYLADIDGKTETNTVIDLAMTWPAKLLPRLDQQGLSDQILTYDGSAGLAINAPESPFMKPPRLEIFICPSDAVTNAELARLTYVANSGYYDLDDGGDYTDDQKANGLFHDQRRGSSVPRVKYGADIKDGAGTTIMLSENVHKDESLGSAAVSWLNPVALDPLNDSIKVEQIYGMVWDINGGDPNPDNASQARFNRDPRSPSSYADQERFYARPASNHPEVFNVTFAGGSAKAISENIEYRVYQQLMTPNGAKAVALNDLDFDTRVFMNPPLKESDY
jgi:hypothetical protein